MCSPDMPEAPDPKETAAAQTGTNVSTAVANAALGNVNEYTPDGSKVTKQTGSQSFYDPTTKQTYKVPTYSTYQTLSPAQKAINDVKNKNNLGMGNLATQAIGSVKNLFNTQMDTSKVPKAGNAASITMPKYDQFAAGPTLKTGYDAGGKIQSDITNNASQIQKNIPGADDFSADRQKYEDALMSRMNPQLQQDRAALEQQMVNQGLAPGSEAYNRAMDTATRQANDARYGAILNAGTEQQRMFDMGLSAGNFHNTAVGQEFNQGMQTGAFHNAAQQQGNTQNANAAQFYNQGQQGMADNAYRRTAANNQVDDQMFNAQTGIFNAQNTAHNMGMQEAADARARPLNEITALMAGSQVSRPTYVGANMPTLPTVDYAGLQQQAYQNNMGQWSAQNANSQGLIGGIGGLFGSVLAASDRRLKTDVYQIGTYGEGLGMYRFRYINPADGEGWQIGMMADEVQKVKPEAVFTRSDGMMMVDYGQMGFELNG